MAKIWALARTVVGFMAGLLIVLGLVVGVELLSSVLHPFPSDFAGSRDEICLHVAKYPAWVLGIVVVAWGLIASIGTWIARRTGNIYSATLLGSLIVAAVGFNIAMLPYPAWFKVVILLAVPVAAIGGALLSPRSHVFTHP